jgi:hypothetical protein
MLSGVRPTFIQGTANHGRPICLGYCTTLLIFARLEAPALGQGEGEGLGPRAIRYADRYAGIKRTWGATRSAYVAAIHAVRLDAKLH